MNLASKNISPQNLTIIGSLITSVFNGILFLASTGSWKWTLLIVAGSFIFSYLVFYYLNRKFIQDRIRLIYKMIAQTKATKKEDFYNKKLLPEQSIEEVGQDVEKWAEQRKLEMETMQKNETFRKEFLQNLSHELKTPIFAIQGYVDTLMSGALHQEDVGIKFLKNTSRNVERLTTLIKDLDEISRLESGELKLQYEHFNIHTLASDVLENLELKIKEKNIQAGFKKDADQDFNVYGDKEKIRQVLINLVDNAIKYGKQEGGRIEIAFFRFDNESIIVEITDNGSGISEEHRMRIFERFFRTDTARARKEGGSGLGLAICKHIIEAHGQTIHVRSTVDVGTTFVFSMALVK